MRLSLSRPVAHWRRWLPPLLTSGAVAAYALAPVALAGTPAHPDLPARSPQQLLNAIHTSTVAGYSGTVSESADLGLPDIPSSDLSSSGDTDLSELQTLLTGSNTLQVASAGGDDRVALLGPTSETDLVMSKTSGWLYQSAQNSVTQLTLPTAVDQPSRRTPVPTNALTSPPQAAALALSAIGPDTDATVSRSAKVAGRPVYTLTLTPQDPKTLVSGISISVDAATGLPLAAAIYAVGHSRPALSVSFRSISLHVPAAATFAFRPPPGAKITRLDLAHSARFLRGEGDHAAVTFGTGWSTVEEFPAVPLSRSDRAQLGELSTAISAGSLITTRLLTVLITPSGAIFLGAVAPAVVEAAAAQ